MSDPADPVEPPPLRVFGLKVSIDQHTAVTYPEIMRREIEQAEEALAAHIADAGHTPVDKPVLTFYIQQTAWEAP